jgi:predicted TIM-barrel fold metal-dependent hydrolase
MEIVDFQLHEPSIFLDWKDAGEEVQEKVLTEALFSTLDAVGIDAAVLNPCVGADAWAERLSEEYPWKFTNVPMLHGGSRDFIPAELDPGAPDIDEQIAKTFARPAVRTIRFMPGPHLLPGEYEKFQEGAYDRALRACERQGVPVMVHIAGGLSSLDRIAGSFPELQIIIDHIGLPAAPGEPDDDPLWKELPAVLALAKYPNVAIKLCGAVAFSAEAYPYTDVWPYLHQLVDAFGARRLAWASDISRFRGRMGFKVQPRLTSGTFRGKHTLLDALTLLLYTGELSQSEKEQILGKSARDLINWPGKED